MIAMITMGMDGNEIRKQIEADLPALDKCRARLKKSLEKRMNKERLVSPMSVSTLKTDNMNEYLIKTFVWKGKIRTMWLCMASVWGKGVDFITYKNGEVSLFTAHVAKRLKERIFNISNSDAPSGEDRIIQSGMAVLYLFHPGENYPGMIANKGAIFTSKMRFFKELSDDSVFLIKCLRATLIATYEKDMLRVKTAIADSMLAERNNLNRDTFIFLATLHMAINKGLHVKERHEKARKFILDIVSKIGEDNIQTMMFNTLPGGKGKSIEDIDTSSPIAVRDIIVNDPTTISSILRYGNAVEVVNEYVNKLKEDSDKTSSN